MPPSPISAALPLAPALRRLCTVVRTMVLLGAAMLLCIVPWVWTSADRVRDTWGSSSGLAHSQLTIDGRALLLGGFIVAVQVAVALFALWQLWQLFGHYREGHVFSRGAQVRLRRFALGVVAIGLMAPLGRTLLGLVLTLGNPPGQHMLLITISSDDYLAVLVGLVLLAIAAVMAEAVRVAEEHAEFV